MKYIIFRARGKESVFCWCDEGIVHDDCMRELDGEPVAWGIVGDDGKVSGPNSRGATDENLLAKKQ